MTKQNYLYKTIFLCVFALVISIINISAATFTVTNTNDSGTGSLRQAVSDANAAASADTIVFDSSFNVQRTITVSSGIDISPAAGADTLTITGPGANLLTIVYSGFNNVRIIQNSVNNGGADTTTISGITFAQSRGGAILNWATLNISNCAFLNNSDTEGFTVNGLGINNTGTGTLTVSSSVFSGNSGNTVFAGNGGAIRNDGTATITNSTFTSNTAASGGAIASFGVLSVSGSTFTNNNAFRNGDFGGGAIFSSRDTTELTATITNCAFNGNTAPGNFAGGGAVRNGSGRMVINGSTFTGNTTYYGGGGVFNTSILAVSGSTFTGNKTNGLFAGQGEGNGGAIYHQLSAQTTIADSLISGNEASNSGGGIAYNTNGGTATMTVTNTTISNNLANTETTQSGGAGGGIFADGPGIITVTSSTINGNSTNGGGGGIQCGGFSGCVMNLGSSIIANNTSGIGPDLSGDFTSQGYNLIENTAGASIGGTLTGNILGVDPKLGALSFNGGQTRTHALLAGSPAIDAGNPTTFPATDQRGITRPQDGDGTGGARADIGAFERRPIEFTQSAFSDLDGDGRADISVFRPSSGSWFLLNSSNNAFSAVGFGISTDVIAPADFDGDGKTDISVYRNGNWYRLNSSNNSFTGVAFGLATDIPVPADFDGDSKADINVFRPSNGTWYRLNSSNNALVATAFGTNGDKPVIGDFDGDGKADVTVYRPSAGAWYRLNSSNGAFVSTSFGIASDLVVPADYDGDGKTDISVFRPSNGTWYRLNSSNGAFVATAFGQNGDLPVAADFDGDGKADVAVFRPSNGTWYQLRSTNGFAAQTFGTNGDIPTPNAFVR
ncbi:MAG TPA: VCBS repeat-containing protein [Pyrinomonadaceae bacterium]|nr:VCBS repeat-containing protein [Pyrinomonadaceae bacterium]